MKWHFTPLPRGQVEAEVTQRDQFNNDEVNISETIVREAVQNSLDAAASDSTKVKVVFRFLDKADGLNVDYMAELLDGQLQHARAADLELEHVNFDSPTALIIEDFGTIGLEGQTDEKDDKHFTDFWRRHGKSHKTGRSRGRWGLGKLVYSCTSQVGVFFGLTRREGDCRDHLMGQTVLNLREVDGERFPPHAYFADFKDVDDPFNCFPVPIDDEGFVSGFKQSFRMVRGNEKGLSIVIPFPSSDLKKEEMIGIAIQNYFYPIITDKLELEIGGLMITRENVRELAHQYASGRFQQIDVLFNFIEEASALSESGLFKMKESWCKDSKLDEGDFEPEVLKEIRSRFVRGELVGLHLPITITRKDGRELASHFSIFVQRPDELEKGLDLYVRGGLTLPGEAKFRERRALGVLIAEHYAICALLGDAENAAHTLWTSNTEKLRKNYRNNQLTVTVIKKALVQLYDLLAEVTEQKDEDALNQFFWFEESEKEKKTKKRKKPRPVVIPNIPVKPRRYAVTKISGGFCVRAAPGVDLSNEPLQLQVKAAYDVARGDAFKKWSSYDFDVAKDITTSTSGGGLVVSCSDNKWIIEMRSNDFEFRAEGFDLNRDLKVSVR